MRTNKLHLLFNDNSTAQITTASLSIVGCFEQYSGKSEPLFPLSHPNFINTVCIPYASQFTRIRVYPYRKLTRTPAHTRDHIAHVLAFAWVLVREPEGWNGTTWPRRAKSEPRGRGSALVCGVGVSVSVPFPPPPSFFPPSSPLFERIPVASSPFNAIASPAATVPPPGKTGGVRREGEGPWINTTAGRGGVWANVARAYAAPRQGWI